MSTELARRIVLQGTEVKRTRAKEIEAKIREGKCIFPGCDAPMDRRGLCGKHSNAFYSEWRSRSGEQRVQFEAEQIREGNVLASYDPRARKTGNPFSESLRAG